MLFIDAARVPLMLDSVLICVHVNFNYIYLFCVYVCIHIWGQRTACGSFFFYQPHSVQEELVSSGVVTSTFLYLLSHLASFTSTCK